MDLEDYDSDDNYSEDFDEDVAAENSNYPTPHPLTPKAVSKKSSTTQHSIEISPGDGRKGKG